MDAVLAVYHGHGGMGADGAFFAPLGANWDNRSDAVSTNMRLGNEVVNYVFWSTCNSLRVKEGHDPIRTWHAANLGFRMLFGFETTSVDHAGYGRCFWEQDYRPKSYSAPGLRFEAHLPGTGALGGRGRRKRPGTNARLEQERLLEWGHVSNGWYQWWWYDRTRAAADPQEAAPRNLHLPGELLVAELLPPAQSLEQLRDIAGPHGVQLQEPLMLRAGLLVAEGEGQALSISADGRYELSLGEPNASNTEALSTEEAKRRATELIGEHELDRDVEIEFDSVRRTMSAGGAPDNGDRDGPRVVETTVQFRQMINGLPVVSQDAAMRDAGQRRRAYPDREHNEKGAAAVRSPEDWRLGTEPL